MDFKDKVVIVTGSTSGIGQALAISLAQSGAKVTIHGQDPQRIKDTLTTLKGLNIPDANVLVVKGPIQEESTQESLVNLTVARFGQIDVLVNNAGTSHHKDFGPFSSEQFDFVMSVNVKSMYAICRLALPHLKATKGNIVNVSSVSGQRAALFWQFYRMSKAAVDHATRLLALDFSRYGVRVNAVSPGVVQTNFITRNVSQAESDESFERYKSFIPFRRLGTFGEIVQPIMFLASGMASYITGIVMNVDGGMVLGPPVPLQAESS